MLRGKVRNYFCCISCYLCECSTEIQRSLGLVGPSTYERTHDGQAQMDSQQVASKLLCHHVVYRLRLSAKCAVVRIRYVYTVLSVRAKVTKIWFLLFGHWGIPGNPLLAINRN